MILSDEIYSEIYYAERPPSILDVPDILGSGISSSTAFQRSMR